MDASTRRYFQYLGDDSTQLCSNVVRVFSKSYPTNEPIDVASIVQGQVDFHSHVLLPLGRKQGVWRKVGRAPPPRRANVLFRDSDDVGDPTVRISKRWFVWKINGRHKVVGELIPKYQHADIGPVVPSESLVFRMRNGRYDFVYPDFR